MKAAYIRLVRGLVLDELTRAADDQIDAITAYSNGQGDWQKAEDMIERCRTLHSVDRDLAEQEAYARMDEAGEFSGIPDFLPELDEIELVDDEVEDVFNNY